MLPVAPAAAETTMVSPFLGAAISMPKKAVSPLIPSSPRNTVSETKGIFGTFWKAWLANSTATFLQAGEARNAVSLSVIRMTGLDDFREAEGTHDFADGDSGKITVGSHPDAHRRIDGEIFHAGERLAVLQTGNRRFLQLQIARRKHAFRPRVQNELAIDGGHGESCSSSKLSKKADSSVRSE